MCDTKNIIVTHDKQQVKEKGISLSHIHETVLEIIK